jgi:glycosyltransferase involved in cell wall biosynthesis
MSEKISVLICTYNRPQLLAQCLRALVDNTIAKPDQIVVVNGGDARTDRVVESIQNYAPTSLEIKISRLAAISACHNALAKLSQ